MLQLAPAHAPTHAVVGRTLPGPPTRNSHRQTTVTTTFNVKTSDSDQRQTWRTGVADLVAHVASLAPATRRSAAEVVFVQDVRAQSIWRSTACSVDRVAGRRSRAGRSVGERARPDVGFESAWLALCARTARQTSVALDAQTVRLGPSSTQSARSEASVAHSQSALSGPIIVHSAMSRPASISEDTNADTEMWSRS